MSTPRPPYSTLSRSDFLAQAAPATLAPASKDPSAILASQYMRQNVANAGISLGATALQGAAMAIKTPQDKHNNAQLDLLEAAQARGEMADTPQAAMNRLLHRQDLAKAGQVGEEAQMRSSATLAGQGGSMSAADVELVHRAAATATQQAATAAGQAKGARDIAELQRQVDEAEARRAYKSERTKGGLQFASQAVSGAAGLVGTVRAANAVKDIDWGDTGYSPTEQMFYMHVLSGKDVGGAFNSLNRTSIS